MDTLYFLQHYWWALVALLGAILVFLLFVQGAQGLLLRTAFSEDEKDLVVKYAGHKWEITFTTLVTFGGAAFASFPLFYSTSFGGAYWLWICILLLFVIQAFSFEYRKAAGNIFGARTFEIFLFLNGALGTFLLGVAVGTFFTGGAFTVDKVSITDAASPAISTWANGWHGLDALKPDVGAFADKCRRRLMITAPAFVLTFVAFVLWLFLRTGYVVDPATGVISPEPFKYLHNILHTWWIAVVFLLGVVLVLAGLGRHFLGKGIRQNFYIVGDTAYYVSTVDIQDSLTLYNSSSSLFTLKVMAWVSLAIPFVIAYIVWMWRRMR